LVADVEAAVVGIVHGGAGAVTLITSAEDISRFIALALPRLVAVVGRHDLGQRRTRLDDWDPAFLRELATGSREDALVAVLAAQGMDGLPAPVSRAGGRQLLAAGHQPMYRGIFGELAEHQAEQFRTGQRPFVGWAGPMRGSGTNFTTDPLVAAKYAFGGVFPIPNPFRPIRRLGTADVTLVGYLRRDAVALDVEQAEARRDMDVAGARQRGDHRLAELLADLGVWAALNGIDALYLASGPTDRHYLVLNRAAMFVESAG
jgi:hypothetical protein